MQCISRWHCTDLFQAEGTIELPEFCRFLQQLFCSLGLPTRLNDPPPQPKTHLQQTPDARGSMIVSRFVTPSRLYFSSSSSAPSLPRSHSCQSRTAAKPVISTISSLRAPHPLCLHSNPGTHSTPPASPETSRTAICLRAILNHLIQFRLKQMSRRQVGSILVGGHLPRHLTSVVFCEAVGFCCAGFKAQETVISDRHGI